ncbi:MAG: ABC transporter ATP-binding protein/permease [Pelatocladus maniniholoensis HA4357-MV3]|jgi:subfamily B ATP-binding cassette protein MsbA|uniref:histidine kinase n=1 Tax=Pelatocladus maniniholoensis HA4357-MV3 TaxID=1117104 RepID=A0A9E3LV17_9NOST|nr:ABC transporter ATP-binding protein/permease [Pelatocladus maniniholoensis HA4357-MV3]BAZ68723.1 ABC transporter-related protein [Fischerella sp. NIES-4106]
MSTRKLLLRFAKPYPGLIFLTIVLGFSGALFNGVGTALIVPVILKIVGQEVDFSSAPPILKAIIAPFENMSENNRLWLMSGAIILIIFLKNIASYASALTSSYLSRRLTSDMREAGVQLLLEIDIDYYAKIKIGDLMNRLGGEIGRSATTISNTVKLVILGITILVFVGLLISISWQLTIAATILLSFVTLINQYVIARSRIFGKLLSEMSKAYSVAILEILSGIRLVKATGNEEREYQRIQQFIREREKADFRSQINSEAIAPISEVMGVVSLLLIVILSRTFFKQEITSLSTVLLTYLLILLRLLPLIAQLNTLRNSFANATTSVEVTADFLRRDDKPLMKNGSVTYTNLNKSISFNHISFAYPGHEKMVLKDVDLSLPRGTTLALVGTSGAGKSTVADLLPRFYDPISGSITIDGIDIREFEITSLRKGMGIVSQDTFLFNDSVRNNIAYGRTDATDDEIITATQQANAYEFITKLPQGFDTLIGDRGVMLSGGQKQRLAIARALLQNPDILILDEATSALDTVSERLVQEAIDDLSRDRTTLVIAHRLSTVQKADQIAVLDQGRVVEVGTHEELLQKNGHYSRLYLMQFGEQQAYTSKHQEGLIRISHEFRTRLNSMIGLLLLLVDNLADNPQERQDLVVDAYKSALKILNIVDVVEDVVNMETTLKNLSLNQANQNINPQDSNLINTAKKFHIDINEIINYLRLLVNNSIDDPQQENEFIQQALQSAIRLLNYLETFEDSIKLN